MVSEGKGEFPRFVWVWTPKSAWKEEDKGAIGIAYLKDHGSTVFGQSARALRKRVDSQALLSSWGRQCPLLCRDSVLVHLASGQVLLWQVVGFAKRNSEQTEGGFGHGDATLFGENPHKRMDLPAHNEVHSFLFPGQDVAKWALIHSDSICC